MRWPFAASVAVLAVACASGGAEPPPAPPPPAPPPPAPVADADAAQSGGNCSGPAPAPDYECVKNCGPPVAQEGDPDPGWSWLSPKDAESRRQFGCPICLPGDARIATPAGSTAVSELRVGALVWSVADDGRRVAARVRHVASVAAPNGHELAVIELSDGRVLRASPGHPGPDGRAIGSLSAGDALDGSVVVRVRRAPYQGRTYDFVLDAGRTRYLSDGVVVQSSLAR